MKRTTYYTRLAVGAVLATALVPGAALAASGDFGTAEPVGLEAAESGDPSSTASGPASGVGSQSAASESAGIAGAETARSAASETPEGEEAGGAAVSNEGAGVIAIEADSEAESSGSMTSLLASIESQIAVERAAAAANMPARRVTAQVATALAEQTDKVLAYAPADIATIGNQAASGHTICCPSYSCAYADAVLDGTVHDHSYYVCRSCRWTDWGGGNSSFRVVGSGSDAYVLREAYDEIAAGRPTVVHVSAGYGEHWIALIGYAGATDPDNLTLANFIALDPWDGAQIVASDRFRLYGDGCQHVSDRA